MSRGLVICLIILAVVLANMVYLIQSVGGIESVPALLKEAGITLPTK